MRQATKKQAKNPNAERDKNHRLITEALTTVINNPDCPDLLHHEITGALMEVINERGGYYWEPEVMRVWLPKAMRELEALQDAEREAEEQAE